MPQVVYAFIDSQNLNLGVMSFGKRLDFERFRVYLRDKFKVEKAFLFLGFIPKNKKMYNLLESFGYELVFKKTTKDSSGKIKGNVDAELVLWAARVEYDNYDQAIIVSGDGDFYCLIDFLKKENKLKKIIVPNNKYSTLLRVFTSQILNLASVDGKVFKKQKREAFPRDKTLR